MPLPENAVKELISRGFVRLVANQAGFLLENGELDFGVDLTLRHVEFLDDPDKVRWRMSGFAVDVQVKATCERNTIVTDSAIKYDLEVENYNHLVRRATQVGTIPLVLALFVLPDDPADWVSIAASELTLRRCGYIWRPDAAAALSDNSAKKRIEIPLTSRLQATSFERLYAEYAA